VSSKIVCPKKYKELYSGSRKGSPRQQMVAKRDGTIPTGLGKKTKVSNSETLKIKVNSSNSAWPKNVFQNSETRHEQSRRKNGGLHKKKATYGGITEESEGKPRETPVRTCAKYEEGVGNEKKRRPGMLKKKKHENKKNIV